MVVDDTPPYLSQGPNALADWIAVYRNDQPMGTGNAKTTLRFLQPKSVEIKDTCAYVAVPGGLDGRAGREA